MQVGEPNVVEKGWGCEVIFANEPLYCGKIMKFKAGEKTSMHFHAEKIETFYVLNGHFVINTINTTDASNEKTLLLQEQTMKIPKFLPHQIEALIDGEIIEVSTHDCVEDSYRVSKGSTQTKKSNYEIKNNSKLEEYEYDYDDEFHLSKYYRL